MSSIPTYFSLRAAIQDLDPPDMQKDMKACSKEAPLSGIRELVIASKVMREIDAKAMKRRFQCITPSFGSTNEIIENLNFFQEYESRIKLMGEVAKLKFIYSVSILPLCPWVKQTVYFKRAVESKVGVLPGFILPYKDYESPCFIPETDLDHLPAGSVIQIVTAELLTPADREIYDLLVAFVEDNLADKIFVVSTQGGVLTKTLYIKP